MRPEPRAAKRPREQQDSATRGWHVWSITQGDPRFPARLANVPPLAREKTLYGVGDRNLLNRKCVGLICSVQCPGSIVIKTFDLIRELRDASIVVVGGFHSPMEQECLEFLLRGNQPVIIAAARGLSSIRPPIAWRTAVDSGRLLIVSLFNERVRRTTKASAHVRNELIVNLASAVLIPHASPGGQAEAIARIVMATRKPLFTFAADENHNLHHIGARPLDFSAFMSCLGE